MCKKVSPLHENMFHSWLVHFFIDFPRFLFKHLFSVYLFSSFSLPVSSCFSPGLCLPLRFFTLLFFIFFFHHFSLCSLCFVFLFFLGGGAHFSCSVFPSFWLRWFLELFLSTFASPIFLSFPLLLKKKPSF